MVEAPAECAGDDGCRESSFFCNPECKLCVGVVFLGREFLDGDAFFLGEVPGSGCGAVAVTYEALRQNGFPGLAGTGEMANI